MEQELIHYEELDSTNAELKRLAERGIATDGTVVIADMQTAGRGRRGRVWHSPANGNLYMSIFVKPDFEVEKASMLTLLMAYGVASVLNEQGIYAEIKWPNDLVLSGRKICGILTELHYQEGMGHYLIIGLGLNLSREQLPEELKDLAGGIYTQPVTREEKKELAKRIIHVFQELYQQFRIEQDLKFIKDEYNHILVNLGRQVRVLDPKEEYNGIALGIDANGRLRVAKENGEETLVFAGEVSVRGIYGYV